MAAEAVENLSVWIDVKTRSFFLMKGAKGDEIGARPLQWQVRANDIDNVIGVADTFAGVVRESHGMVIRENVESLKC